MTEIKANFQAWAIVELMGHSKIAGHVTEMQMGGNAMLRVDVPETTQVPAFTRIFNPSALYAINPVTEEMAKQAAESYKSTPVMTFDMQRMVNKMVNAKMAMLEAPEPDLEKVDPELYNEEDDDIW